MSFSLNKVVQPQKKALNKQAKIFSSALSPLKRPYLEGEKPKIKLKDGLMILKCLKDIYKLPLTMKKTVSLIKDQPETNKKKISRSDFDALNQLFKKLNIDDYGFFEIKSERLFKGYGSPYMYGIVISSQMDLQAFKKAPSMNCQLQVAKVYAKTGEDANKVAAFLQNKGYGGCPNHSMGGQLDYSMAAQWAGIARTGKHSMAITKRSGPCHRLSVIYTNIENLGDFISNDIQELSWIQEFCESCENCIKSCPTKAILKKPKVIDGKNPTRIDYNKCCDGFKKYGCGICVKVCPFTQGNYQKIKTAFLNKKVKIRKD